MAGQETTDQTVHVVRLIKIRAMVGNVDHVVLIIGFALRPPCGFPAGRTLRVAIGTLPNPRAYLARAVRERIAGDFEAQHAEIWRTGERWFTEQDAIWRVHADTSMFIGGIRARAPAIASSGGDVGGR